MNRVLTLGFRVVGSGLLRSVTRYDNVIKVGSDVVCFDEMLMYLMCVGVCVMIW